MWPHLQLPGTDATVSTYYVLHFASWLTFLAVGLTITRSRPELRSHWWWLFYGLIVCDSVGAYHLAQIVEGPKGRFWGAPALFAVWTAVYALAMRLRSAAFRDAWAIAFSASLALGKLACVAAGCCLGRPTDSPIGLAVRLGYGDPTPRLPLSIVEASLHLITASVLGLLAARGWLPGRLVLLLGAIYATWRGIIESLRADPSPAVPDGLLSIVHVLCLSVLVFSVAGLLSGRGACRPSGGGARARPPDN